MTSHLNMSQSTSTILPSGKSFRSHRLSTTSAASAELDLSSPRHRSWQIAPNLFLSFKYAWAGICYAFETQRNFRIHTTMTVLAISLGLFLKVNATGMAIVSLTCALVMVLELLNTALESVVDLTVGQSYHELAKIAKDCAAGAVMISAMASVLVASFILLPPLLPLLLTL
ncbi:diacylglycerol kinase [Rippkaea orientalis PCC 8801]|uniref:Diacylglycerol kinase n=1 Tax=Rippkaea orientalis (strain PCC 8801 / RF-1) TaxID=41431 RepID=B7K198_RIPO1|nr:diacylglycerol kinase family protein [Rippkaea orientalis]ACK66293.1 diacylglycerol kinase [Rippkaea orientalis PCC 8801]